MQYYILPIAAATTTIYSKHTHMYRVSLKFQNTYTHQCTYVRHPHTHAYPPSGCCFHKRAVTANDLVTSSLTLASFFPDPNVHVHRALRIADWPIFQFHLCGRYIQHICIPGTRYIPVESSLHSSYLYYVKKQNHFFFPSHQIDQTRIVGFCHNRHPTTITTPQATLSGFHAGR